MTTQAIRRLAAIDIGSNSTRLMVAEATSEQDYRILDDHKETTRLAHGLAATGQLSEAAMSRTLDALRRMKAIIEGYQVDKIAVIATSAVRETVNGPVFVQRTREELGLDIRVISGQEEGELSYHSAEAQFPLRELSVVCMDIGGGSAELVFAAQGQVDEIYSLPVGAVRMTEAFLHGDPPASEEWRQFKLNLRQQFANQLGNLTFYPNLMVGAGGTFTALANISLRLRGQGTRPVRGYEMTRSDVRQILERLRHCSLAERRAIPGLNADRADIISAGVFVIDRFMKWLHVNRLVINDRGVRDGLIRKMLLSSAARKAASDEKVDPISSVQEFGHACQFEPRHAAHVAKLAGQLFAQLQKPLKLPPGERCLAEAAAWLHEVGGLISYEKHHEHSYHLIRHGQLRGWTGQQRELIAQIARYHRKSPPKRKHPHFARLTPGEQATVKRMSAILRIADGLDRTHTQRIQKLSCVCQNDVIRLTVYSQSRPDVDIWGAQQKGKLFEKLFDRQLVIDWQPLPGPQPEPVKETAATMTS